MNRILSPFQELSSMNCSDFASVVSWCYYSKKGTLMFSKIWGGKNSSHILNICILFKSSYLYGIVPGNLGDKTFLFGKARLIKAKFEGYFVFKLNIDPAPQLSATSIPISIS